VVSSAIYVGNHIYRLGQGPFECLMLFAFGLAYAAAAERFNSLWPAIGLHWGWNFADEWSGSVVDVTTRSANAGRLLSACAHLLLLLIVLGSRRYSTRADIVGQLSPSPNCRPIGASPPWPPVLLATAFLCYSLWDMRRQTTFEGFLAYNGMVFATTAMVAVTATQLFSPGALARNVCVAPSHGPVSLRGS
jgi:hypothetical protein